VVDVSELGVATSLVRRVLCAKGFVCSPSLVEASRTPGLLGLFSIDAC
jgi:hypothetical protein